MNATGDGPAPMELGQVKVEFQGSYLHAATGATEVQTMHRGRVDGDEA